MSTLLIKNIHQLVTCDDEDRVLHNADLYCEDGFIKAIGTALDISADEVIDGSHMLCYPGLVNTHHHLYQVFSRNLPQVQNMELFDWLKTLYEIWKNLDEDVIRLSTLTGLGELMKHGCTTCFDHHYVFPAHSGDLLGAQRSAASTVNCRNNFADRRKLREAQIVFCSKNTFKKIVHAAAQAFVNQVSQRFPPAAPAVVSIVLKLFKIKRPALLN